MSENNKKKLSRLLVCCEGETEKEYLTTLAGTLELTPRVSVRKTSACAPMSLLEEAYKEYMWSNVTDKQFPFTEVWCVFDRDHHPSYDATFEVAKTLGIPVHLCWTNPCIEFWFWLHYCGDKNQLKFDEFIEVARSQERVVISTDEFEERLVRRLRRSIKPDTMLALLKEKCPAYSKAKCPPGVIKRTPTACDNLKVVAQSEDPKRLGSAMPELLLRFANLHDEIHPTKPSASICATQTSAVAPSSTEAKLAPQVQKAPTPTATSIQTTSSDQPKPADPNAAPIVTQALTPAVATATNVEKPAVPKGSNPITVGWSASDRLESTSGDTLAQQSCQSHKESKTPTGTTATHKNTAPVDPHQSLLEPLKLCLRDWAFIHVTAAGLDYPPGALVHFDQFFTKAVTIALDCKTRDRGNIGLGALKNIRKLITANEAAPNKDRADKIAGRLYAIGNLLMYFAQDFGIQELLKGLSFEKQTPTEVRSAESVTPSAVQKPISLVEGISATAPEAKPASVTAVVPEQKTPEESLSQAVEDLHRLRNRFYALMSGMVMASDGAKAYEMTKGYCERSAELQEEAVRILNACTELATAAPSLNKE